MSIFEKATRQKLRFETSVGYVSIEDLWDLPLSKLNDVAKKLNKDIKNEEEEDFLEETSKEDTTIRLKFDVVLHILQVKKKERDERKEAQERKAKKQRLLEVLERKEDEALEGLSKEEILKEIENLG